MPTIDLITISREFGAGGSALAAALGARLRWPVLDHGIADAVAARMGVPVGDVRARDEHAPGLLERLGGAVLVTSPDFAPTVSEPPLPVSDDIAAVTRELLLEAARSAPLVIVGHGAQVLFHERPRTLHLRLVAPLVDRLRLVRARVGCAEPDALALARRMDADRQAYVRRYYERDLRDPLLYHLLLNTGRVPPSAVESLVVALVEDGGDPVR